MQQQSPLPVYPPAPQTNPWAIVSLIASILAWLGLFGVGGIVGIITGFIARREIAASGGAQTGDELAIAGIALGALNILTTCIGALCVAALFVLLFGASVISLPFISD
ncbi:MAG: DUF4190 domain-containing protein [Thermoflexales bacterium]|nr:DUF4190 domain-containing protein [Thermoflexales bacterium]MCS7323945.1 DUF4190 domain-containing protein [Thermoflexales bacterium]MCX7938276.1 DUF4190 domain-containing protein [Thermoflexales bacterium]MDW8053498.1 DUF4190 domain-containing protein [Anaerolineae bacterium]MDW8292206.1 DUF4190 domain-containing protein [Anaerolineae bacterium]